MLAETPQDTFDVAATCCGLKKMKFFIMFIVFVVQSGDNNVKNTCTGKSRIRHLSIMCIICTYIRTNMYTKQKKYYAGM